MAETRIRLDKQIQKAPGVNMVPLSDAGGELQFSDLTALVKSGETKTTLDSVTVNSGNLVIKYTGEDGQQQVLSTVLAFSETDIKVSDAILENPSAGVYRIIISQSDGGSHTVDLSELLAVVTQNTTYVRLEGNGTPENPLRVDLTQAFWESLPRTLDVLDDVTVSPERIDQELVKGGTLVLVWDNDLAQWVPRSTNSFETFRDRTEVFNELRSGNTVSLSMEIFQIIPESIRVYRNGMRQEYGVDYDFNSEPNQILFFEPFTDLFTEKVIVDYRPLPLSV